MRRFEVDEPRSGEVRRVEMRLGMISRHEMSYDELR